MSSHQKKSHPIAGTSSDANGNGVNGLMSTEGGNLVFGTGATATFRDLNIKNGIVTIEDGANVTARYVNIGNGGNTSGIINQTGGTLTMEAGSNGIRIGHWSGAGRQYNLTGGVLDATALGNNGGDARYVMMGWDGEGDMTVGGGAGSATLKAAGLKFDRNRGGTGASASTLTLLSKGVVEVGNLGIIAQGTNDGMVMSGGLLRATASSTWTAQMEAIAATTTTIDVGSGAVANQTGLLFGSGDLVKTGNGSLVLGNAANTHSGAIAVNAGTLNVNGALASNVTINTGATLQAGTDTTGGTATISTLLLEDGSSTVFRVGGSTPDLITITGADGFTIATGTTHNAKITPAGQLAIGDEFVIFDYEGTVQGAGGTAITASVSTNPHYNLSVTDDTVNTQVKLTVISVDSVIWTGASGLTWDENNTESWKTETGDAASNFYSFDLVKFNDANSAGGTVNLVGNIEIGSTEFDHSTNDFTLTGSGITGAGGLTKKGTGTLTLLNNNTYTGTADIQAGAVVVGNGGTTGTLGGAGDISVATGASLTMNRSDAVTISRKMVGGGTLIHDGPGNLTMTARDNAVDIIVNSGTLFARGGGWYVNFAQGKTITVNAGATLNSTTHSLGVYNRVPNLNLNGGTWHLEHEQYMDNLTMTGGLADGPGEIRTTGGAAFTINASATGSEMASRINMTGGKTFAVAHGAADADLTVSGVFAGGGAITKTGAGKMLLTAVSSHTGKIAINEGVLALGASASIASTEIFVNSGAEFNVSAIGGIFELQDLQSITGSGNIVGAIQLAQGSVIAPGNSAGTLTFDSAMVLGVGSQLDFELSATDQTVGGGINDLMTGILDLTLDGTLHVAELVTDDFLAATTGSRWVLLEYNGTLSDNGLDLDSAYLPTLAAGLSFELDQSVNGEVALVVVPEPSSSLLLSLAGVLVISRRRRKLIQTTGR